MPPARPTRLLLSCGCMRDCMYVLVIETVSCENTDYRSQNRGTAGGCRVVASLSLVSGHATSSNRGATGPPWRPPAPWPPRASSGRAVLTPLRCACSGTRCAARTQRNTSTQSQTHSTVNDSRQRAMEHGNLFTTRRPCGMHGMCDAMRRPGHRSLSNKAPMRWRSHPRLLHGGGWRAAVAAARLGARVRDVAE